MTHKGVLQTESKTRWESLETQSPLRSAADRCAVADHPSVMLPRKDVIYPNQRQKGVFYFTANPKVFARARLSGTPHMEQKIERSRSKCKSLTQQKLFLNSLLNDAFLWVPPPPQIQSLSLCPGESFMISGMFPMMPHLSVLLWQRARPPLIPVGQLHHSPLPATISTSKQCCARVN